MPHGCQQLFERACRATQFQEMLMLVVGTQVIADRGGKDGFTVEFVGEGGEVVSVEMRNDNGRTLNRMNAIDRAKAMMAQLAVLDTDAVALLDAAGERAIDTGEEDLSGR
jgi:hypothetical protein